MHDQATAAARWLASHRYRIALATALAGVLTLLVVATPLLFVAAAVESNQQRRRRRLLAPVLLRRLADAVVWLWDDLHGAPHGRWNPCLQCGRPIEEPSRAAYCSHACRRYARLERESQLNDPRIADMAERRLRAIRLQRLADAPEWVEVPF